MLHHKIPWQSLSPQSHLSLLAGGTFGRGIYVSQKTLYLVPWLDSLTQIFVLASQTFAKHTASLVSAFWTE